MLNLARRRMVLAILFVLGIYPCFAFADTIGASSETTTAAQAFSDMTEEEIRAAIGKPDEDDLLYAWDSLPEEVYSVGPMTLYEGTASDLVEVALGEADGIPVGGDFNKYNNHSGEPWCAYFLI